MHTPRAHRVSKAPFTKSGLNHCAHSNNGFCRAAIAAYFEHHHLTGRSEDAWLAILTQLGLFVNANAEAMCPFCVAHEGQNEICVEGVRNIDSVNMDAFARQMSELLA